MMSLHSNGHLSNIELIEATMFLKPNMSMIPNNPIDDVEILIRNTLIPSRHELPDDIDNSEDNENEKDDEDDDLSPMPVESEKPIIRVDFEPFNFFVQQHENTKPTKSNTTKYKLFGFV
jgi:hypothetical protein